MSDVSLVDITKRYARSGVVVDNVSLRIQEGEFFTLLGPSGCGKTTTLRMIAGFEEPTSGVIRFGDRDVTYLPTNRRNVGIVFQNYALFPHFNVGKNVGYGLRARKVSAADEKRRVAEALAQVHLSGMEEARVDQLSGGQQQRVALARAIVIRPELLLLDEPLSNLDAKLRDETRAALRQLHAETGKTSIYVTHDQGEALAMSTRIAVMSKGVVHQVGTPTEVYATPATRFVAEFLGRNNIIDGVVESIDGEVVTVKLPDGSVLEADAGRRSAQADLKPGAEIGVAVRAESVKRRSAEQPGANLLDGVVVDVEYVGPRRECTLATAVGILKFEVELGDVGVQRDDRVRVELPRSTTYLLEPHAVEPEPAR